MDLRGKILIELDYQIDPYNQVIELTHPDISGSLEVCFDTLAEANRKLDALEQPPRVVTQKIEVLVPSEGDAPRAKPKSYGESLARDLEEMGELIADWRKLGILKPKT